MSVADRRQLAEAAARRMGWGESPAQPGEWFNADTRPKRVGAPSLDDPAFCWAMLEWLDVAWMREEGATHRDHAGHKVIAQVTRECWPEALARAVLASEEEA